jgi:hypothetical protein
MSIASSITIRSASFFLRTGGAAAWRRVSGMSVVSVTQSLVFGIAGMNRALFLLPFGPQNRD